MPPVRKALNRLARTSWDELRTRLSQEFTKRADYALYRAGLLRQPQVLVGGESYAKFFFQPDELPNRVALLKQHLPSAMEDTIQEAEEILQHRFRLLGYRDLDYGSDIGWHLDAVHGKRAPLQPWYRVRFLEFREVGDHKVTWELNRHQHLVVLAKAWAFTGDQRYSHEIVKQFYSWRAANPYPMGINWGSSLEVAFRGLSWLWLRNLLKQAADLPDSFQLDLLRTLARNGKYIERFLSTYFSPNTHLVGEAVALFFIGTLCPEIPEAGDWRNKGLAIVLAEAQRQARPDGVYFEQSLYYHVYALDFFLHTRALAASNHIALPESFDVILRKMLAVVRALSTNGPPEGFGDDDGGRVFNPRRNRAEHMSDPLALGAALFQDQALGAGNVTEEAIWLYGERAILPTPRSETPRSVAFSQGGIYLMAGDQSRMLIDAGPHGVGSAGHGHADALSVRLSMNGKRWLIDPGSYVYVAPEQELGARDHFRGTSAHNTLRVDRLDQAIPRGPFSWSSLPETNTEQWIVAPRFDFFAGTHNGYTRLSDPAVHRRMIFHLRGEYWLVRDIVEGDNVHDLEIFWHFAPNLQIDSAQAGLRVAGRDGEGLLLLGSAAPMWQVATEDGFASPAYGEKEPAPVGVFRARAQLPTEHATLLLPSNSSREKGAFRAAAAENASAYTYEENGIADSFVFARAAASLTFESFRSDANFLFSRVRHGELELLLLCGATFVEWHGQQILRSENTIPWVQWHQTEGVTASDPTLLKFFDRDVLRSPSAVPLRR